MLFSRKIRVIIYGQHSEDWMTALDSTAPVWKLLPNVISVEIAHNDNPPFAQEGLLKKILSITCFHRTVIIPLMESHLYEMPHNFKSLTATVDTVALMANKEKFSSLLIENGFSSFVPRIYENIDLVEFPVVIKRTDLNAGQGVRIIRNLMDFHDAENDPIFENKNYFLQEYVESERDYVAHIIAKNGKILWSKSFCYSMPHAETIRTPGIHTAITSYTLNSHTLDVFDKIIKLLKYSGPCNIDFRMSDNEPKIFEINPRLGGSLMLPESMADLKENLELIIKHAF